MRVFHPLCFSLMGFVLPLLAVPPLQAASKTVPALTYSSGELYTEIGAVKGVDAPDYHGTAFWYTAPTGQGLMGVVYSQGMDEGGITLLDISNPRAPKTVGRGYDARQREGHTTAFINTDEGILLAALASNGVNLWDLSVPSAPTLAYNIPLDGVWASDYDFGAWWLAAQAPYLYVSGGFNGIYVVDLSDLAQPRVVDQVSMGAGWRTGPVFTVGNLLFTSISDGGQSRIFDISDPNKLELIKEVSHTERFYATWLNGGYLYGAMKVGGLEVIDVHDPYAPVNLSTAFAYGAGAYVMTQDNRAFVGASDDFHGFDIKNPASPLLLNTGHIDGDNDFVSVFGNLLVVSDDHRTGTDNSGSHLIPIQTTPDVTAPVVNYVYPTNGQDWIPTTSRIGLTLTDQVLLSSVTPQTFFVRPVGGTALPGTYSVQSQTLTFFPSSPLLVETEYEVVLTAGGVADLAGNTLQQAFSSRFLTGPTLVNPPKADAGADQSGFVNQAVTLTPGTSQGGVGALEYSWDPGDGSASSPFSSQPSLNHTYPDRGHFTAIVTVRDSRGQRSTDTKTVTIINPPLPIPPTHSSPLVYDDLERRLWTVNPDANSVAVVDVDLLTRTAELPVGQHPTTVTLGSDAHVWVLCSEDASLYRIDAVSLTQRAVVTLPPGSRPYAVVADPSDEVIYVSLEGLNEVRALDGVTGTLLWTAQNLSAARGLAVVEDSIFVTRFLSPSTHGEVFELDRLTGALLKTWILEEDPGPDSEISGRGIPNYLTQIVPSPDGQWLYVPGFKQNTSRGLTQDGQKGSFENTNRAILARLDRSLGDEDLSLRMDLDNRDYGSAIALSPLGDYAFITLQGSRSVLGIDLLSNELDASIPFVGDAPQGAVVTDDETLWVQNFLSRNVVAYDISSVEVASSLTRLAAIRTQAKESLSPQVLLGKRIFYDASDMRMSRDSYIACAGCHIDGGTDKRVWDFTDRGEGLRRTTALRGRGGVLHGPVHWTANFDEIQDFEHDMRNAFGGKGFMSDTEFNTGTRNTTLGDKKTGISPELDALAAYVSSLTRADLAPSRTSSGALSASAQRGKTLFLSTEVGCSSCHLGAHFTDSKVTANPADFVLHDVGTLTPDSGQRMGGPLTGLDTPTLKGTWNNAPYLHDGSASTLMDVLVTRNPANKHGKVSQLSSSQRTDLEAYVKAIDARSGSPVVVSMSPAPAQKLRKVDAITLTFSSFPAPATVSASSVKVMNGTTAVSGTYTLTQDQLRFVPTTALANGTYSVSVSSSLTSQDGDAAVAWSGSFTVDSSLPLVSNLVVYSSRASTYSLQKSLKRGAKPFGDRDDWIVTLPKRYQGLEYIRTASKDQLESRPALVSFDLSAPAKVYVAFDRTHDPLPGWAADFTPMQEYITVTNEDYLPLRVFEAQFPAGKVLLGGPRAGGGMYNKVNYLVMFQAL